MKTCLGLVAALLITGPSISFFKYQRDAQATTSGGQHYIVVDEILWQHGQSDLHDLRLYSPEREVPYALGIEKGSSETERKQIRVLQPARVGGKTQFLLDMSEVADYDRIELKLATKNFVSRARVEGQDNPHGALWAMLAITTLYDLSDERLGHNSTLQIPRTTYKYLRVAIDGSVKPADVQGGIAGITRAQKAAWRTIGGSPKQIQQGKDTVVTFSIPENVPVERVLFEIDPTQPNFRREMEVQGDKGQAFGSGEISRIHIQRGEQKVDAEQNSLDIRGTGYMNLRAIIHNGDDPPLKITSAHLQQYERRIYFDDSLGTRYTLYYGDKKSGAPVYDYSKLFQKDAAASEVELGAEQANVAYTSRPDETPWSERHPAVLWGALVAAVLILGGIALRTMRSVAA